MIRKFHPIRAVFAVESKNQNYFRGCGNVKWYQRGEIKTANFSLGQVDKIRAARILDYVSGEENETFNVIDSFNNLCDRRFTFLPVIVPY